MSQEEQEQQKNFGMQFFFDKGFTLTGVWHWRPSLVLLFRLVWKWIFDFQGCSDTLVVGAGDGKFGLWFDGDLDHGRTQPCQTFGNPPLTSSSDFNVKCIECWAFLPSTWTSILKKIWENFLKELKKNCGGKFYRWSLAVGIDSASTKHLIGL